MERVKKQFDSHYRELIKTWKEEGGHMRPKEIRRIHKELKEYGDGLCFMSRYPNFQLHISVLSFAIVIIEILFLILRCQK